jgi:hypothetical protein
VGLHILFLFNSKFFLYFTPYGAAAVLILILTAMNLSYLPYRNHKTPFTNFERWVCRCAWVTCLAAYPFGYFWDAALVWSTIYIFLPFAPWYAQNKAPIQRYIEEWKASTR